jgi:hypothetical protein
LHARPAECRKLLVDCLIQPLARLFLSRGEMHRYLV